VLDVTVHHDVPATMRDGTVLRADVYRPISNFPRWDRNHNAGDPIDEGTHSRPAHQEIAHDAARPSRIVLPVIPAH
jgi:uncharacterized protein